MKDKLPEVRATFTKANTYIRWRRDRAFQPDRTRMLVDNLRNSQDRGRGRKSLRKMATRLVAGGYYSPKISIKAVELMVLKKLWRQYNDSVVTAGNRAEWDAFVRFTIGDWNNPTK